MLSQYSSVVRIARPLFGLASLLLSASAFSANVTWTGGAGDGLWASGGNWSTGNVPTNNSYSDIAIFGPLATPGIISGSNGISILRLEFQSAGWTIDTHFAKLSGINMTGTGANSGINTLTKAFELEYSYTWNIGTGNTLYSSYVGLHSIYFGQAGLKLTLGGGGTVHLNESFGSWTTAALDLNNITLKIDDTILYTAGADKFIITFNDLTSTLFFQGTLLDAQLWINNNYLRVGSALDGYNLTAAETGDGYVRIGYTIPEPSTYASFAALGVLGIALLRRHKG